MNDCSILILMWYDEDIKEYGDINYEINRKYCEKYGYKIIRSDKRIFNSCPKCEKWTRCCRTKHWERLPLILKHLDQYDYVIWIDADAFFYYDSPPLSNIINKHPNKDFIFSSDGFVKIENYEKNINKYYINSGIFIVKNSDLSKNVLERWAYSDDLMKMRSGFNDQGVLILMYKENILNLMEISVVLPFGILQHFDRHKNKICEYTQKFYPDYDITKPYVKHLAGESKFRRIEVAKNYYSSIMENLI